jgi:hypothetical protein
MDVLKLAGFYDVTTKISLLLQSTGIFPSLYIKLTEKQNTTVFDMELLNKIKTHTAGSGHLIEYMELKVPTKFKLQLGLQKDRQIP